MRTLVRTLAATAALAAFVLVTAVSPALATSPTGDGAAIARYDFDDAWCFDYGTYYDCSVVDATLAVTTTPEGRNIARIDFREVVKSFDPSGVQIGSSRTTSFDRYVDGDGAADQTFSVSHTRGIGPYGTCVSTYLFRIVDFNLEFEKRNGPGCA
jgi:hypothetical protein